MSEAHTLRSRRSIKRHLCKLPPLAQLTPLYPISPQDVALIMLSRGRQIYDCLRRSERRMLLLTRALFDNNISYIHKFRTNYNYNRNLY